MFSVRAEMSLSIAAVYLFPKFHESPPVTFLIIQATNRQTNNWYLNIIFTHRLYAKKVINQDYELAYSVGLM